MVMDLDHFKEVNDGFGHPIGDIVLTAFARVLREQGRASDRLGRLGGDEFIAILPGGGHHAGEAFVERVRTAWTAVRPQPITFSAGIATAGAQGPDDLMKRADEELYRDKSARRSDGLRGARGAA